MAVIKPGRSRHGPARFGQDPGLEGQGPHCGADFILSHRDNVVDMGLDVRPGQRADLAHSQPIRDGLGGLLRRNRDDPAGPQAGLGISG